MRRPSRRLCNLVLHRSLLTALGVLFIVPPVLLVDTPSAHAQQPAQPKPGEKLKPGVVAEDEPFNPDQKRWLEKWMDQQRAKIKEEVEANAPPPPPPQSSGSSLGSIEWKGEFFTKWLYQNDQSNGCVTLGTPNPTGDNYSGNNGICSELNLYLRARVGDRVEVGARIASRFGQQWADYYENGDLATDATGRPKGVDGSGQSLGQNHAAYMQLRGIWVRVSPPIPSIDSILIGSSDLGMFNAWTVGKVRYIDRDNPRGIFVDGHFGNIQYTAARIALPKLFASVNFNTGVDDPFVSNPFWARDASYVLKFRQSIGSWLSWELIGHILIDEEADRNDPDALGSVNTIDRKDGVVATKPRYTNGNVSLDVTLRKPDSKLSLNLFGAYSRSAPDLSLAYNAVDGNQGFSPVPMATVNGYAAKARLEWFDVAGARGFDLKAEYFNIGADWVATFGARREQDVLLTDGFLDGQLPTLNVANEFIDFYEKYYESVIGWHGGTLNPSFKRTFGKVGLELDLEGTALTYNTNMQNRCVRAGISTCPKDASGRSYGVYPDFLYTDGMTDTDFFTYANTNDRGRDPRSVYHENEDRFTAIGVAKWAISYTGEGVLKRGIKWSSKVKYIYDPDGRSKARKDDDYVGKLLFVLTELSAGLTDELTLGVGFKYDRWDEAKRSGQVIAGAASYADYLTTKEKVFVDLRYLFSGLTFLYRFEWLNKDVTTSDPKLDYKYTNVLRSFASVFVPF
jgi:hypothetical protein